MIYTLIKNRWLLAVCGLLYAILAFTYLIMQDRDGSLALRTHAVKSTVVFLGRLALAAGACSIAAGLRRSIQGKCWPLVVNGLSLIVLGLLFIGAFGPSVSFRSIADLLVVMAMSIAVLALRAARNLRSHVADQLLLGLAGVFSLGWAVAFLWMKPVFGSHADILWIGSYFGFTAVCMLAFALRLQGLGRSESGRRESLPPFGNPKHAH